MERRIHARGNVSFDTVKKYRLEKEAPVLDGFFAWLDDQNAIKGSRLDKALIYIRNRRKYLTTYLEDGGCSFNNNTSERSCKAFVTGRKNWLFADTQDGAYASALVYSIVETAKACEIDVYHYLRYLLLKTPTDQTPDEELEKLCPWHPECQNAIKEMQQIYQQTVVNAK